MQNTGHLRSEFLIPMVDSAPPTPYPNICQVTPMLGTFIHASMWHTHKSGTQTKLWSEHLQGRNLFVDTTADGTILIQNLKKQEGSAWTDHLDQEVSVILRPR